MNASGNNNMLGKTNYNGNMLNGISFKNLNNNHNYTNSFGKINPNTI